MTPATATEGREAVEKMRGQLAMLVDSMESFVEIEGER